jgi:hypothetical protein
MRCPVVDLTKYEMTFNGSHKILKVITNGTVRFHFGFLTDTIKINIHGGECNMRLSKKRRQAHD